MPKHSWPRYLTVLAVSALGLIGAMAALNYYADPYGIYHYGTADDPTRSRPCLRDLERLHKAHALRDAHADVLLIGNSRVIVGLDPQHPALTPHAYNLGISAMNAYESMRYLQHAIHLHKPKLVLMAIDKIDFDADGNPMGDFSENRLSVDVDLRDQPGWERTDIPDTLFSTTAVVDSLLTISASRAASPVTYNRGLRDECLMHPYLKTTNVLAENERWKAKALNFTLTDAKGGNPKFEAFRAALRLCALEKIEVIVFTNPLHAELLEIEIGDGRDFSAWLRKVTAIIARESAAGGRPIPFWNFYGYNAITTEPFPVRTQPVSTMKNYWEISHYRRSIGNLLIARVMNWPDERLATLPDFGHLVTAETVGAELDRLTAERTRWQESRLSANAHEH
ncbi:MAG: hypothetical protein K8R23_17455 [Chthoniobacter sp.]|nr:hypothetical protein [Chthoniobacter sp.]